MNKVAGTVFILVLLINFCQGQISNLPDAVGAPLRSKSGESIEGRIHLHEEWNRGTIEWKDDKITQNVFMKYNTISGNLEVQNDNGVWEYSPKTIKTFEYAVNLYPDVVTMRFVPATNYFEGGKGFVKILFQDKIVVFEKIEAQLITNTPSYGTSGAVTKAVQNVKNFIVLPDTQKPIQFKRTNANLSKAIGKEDLKDYLKSKKLDVSENKDLAMAMGYLKTFYK